VLPVNRIVERGFESYYFHFMSNSQIPCEANYTGYVVQDV
jgi:hypothetical protein